MISARDLSKTYAVDGEDLAAVSAVSLTIAQGEIAAVVGHSGSGKTTLLSLIGGLTKPDSGTVTIGPTKLWSLDDRTLSEFRNRTIGFIYQFSSLIPTLTALENVMLPTAFGAYDHAVSEHAGELLRTVGLGDKANAYPSHLSGGQQRRVAIARAFINSPEIILADEPTGDLDEETEAEVIRLFRKMNEERRVTFLIVTHNKEIAAQAGRRFSMTHGKLSEL